MNPFYFLWFGIAPDYAWLLFFCVKFKFLFTGNVHWSLTYSVTTVDPYCRLSSKLTFMILIKHSESRVQLQMLCKWSLNVICKCLNSKRKLQLSQYFEFLVRAFFDHMFVLLLSNVVAFVIWYKSQCKQTAQWLLYPVCKWLPRKWIQEK